MRLQYMHGAHFFSFAALVLLLWQGKTLPARQIQNVVTVICVFARTWHIALPGLLLRMRAG